MALFFNADPLISGRGWPPLASAQNDCLFGAYMDGYSHQHTFHVQPTARHIRRSEGARG
jgi:hypothetical protein